MIIMQGECCECNDGKTKRLAKRRPPLCGYHYQMAQRKKSAEKNKDKPKKILKPLKRTPLKYVKKPTGELILFQAIWDSRPKVSFISGTPIRNFAVVHFAHVLAKGQNQYLHFKLYEKNIVLLTYEEHFLWDNGLRSELINKPEWKKMFELEEKLKKEYNKTKLQ